jgi:hypothetical protein
MHILSLQLIQAGQLFFEFINRAKTAATVGCEEGLSIGFFDPKALP